MSEPELHQQLRQAVEQHPAQMSRDAEEAMEQLLDQAAARLAAEPDRADEARRNLERLLDRAAEAAHDETGGADVLTLERAEVDAGAIQLALRDLCPIFPIC